MCGFVILEIAAEAYLKKVRAGLAQLLHMGIFSEEDFLWLFQAFLKRGKKKKLKPKSTGKEG